MLNAFVWANDVFTIWLWQHCIGESLYTFILYCIEEKNCMKRRNKFSLFFSMQQFLFRRELIVSKQASATRNFSQLCQLKFCA